MSYSATCTAIHAADAVTLTGRVAFYRGRKLIVLSDGRFYPPEYFNQAGYALVIGR